MFKFVFFIICFLFLNNIAQASIFSDYRAKNAYSNNEFKKTIQILEKEQVEKPHEPILNYNLGTAYYKLDDFEQAKHNLHRCVAKTLNVSSDCTEEQSKIREKAYFNLGNTLYKSGLKLLGNDWEKKKISSEILDKAITEIKSSIEKYRNVLVLNKDNEWANSNKKKAEELLKKLEEKKQQNKDNKDSEQKDDDKNKSESNSNDKQDSSQENNKGRESKQSDQQNQRKNSSQDSKENGNKGKDKELDSKKNPSKDHDMDKREQDFSSNKNDSNQNSKQKQDKDLEAKDQETGSQDKSSTDKKGTDGQQVGTQQAGEKNDIKSKMFRAVLDDLQNDEAELQKALIRYKSKGANPRLNKGQKPW